MGVVRVRVYTTHSGEPLDALIARLEYPVPLLEELGYLLASELERNIAPHSPGKLGTGTLASGLRQVSLYRKRGKLGENWAVGIGDPQILTDWNEEAPSGTIAAFLKWLASENKARSEKRGKIRQRKADAKEAERAERKRRRDERANRSKQARNLKAENEKAFRETFLELVASGKIPSERIAKLWRRYFARAGYAEPRRLARQFAELYKFSSASRRKEFLSTISELFRSERVLSRYRAYQFAKTSAAKKAAAQMEKERKAHERAFNRAIAAASGKARKPRKASKPKNAPKGKTTKAKAKHVVLPTATRAEIRASIIKRVSAKFNKK